MDEPLRTKYLACLRSEDTEWPREFGHRNIELGKAAGLRWAGANSTVQPPKPAGYVEFFTNFYR